MASSLLLSLRADVSVSTPAAGELVLFGPRGRVALRQLPPGTRDALCRLAPPGDGEDRLTESVLAAGGPAALPRWYYCLQQLARRGLLLLSAHAGGAALATLVPTAPGFAFTPGTAPLPGRPYVLSRFACVRRAGDELVLESPLSLARVVLHDYRAAALVHALARPGTPDDLAGRAPGLDAEAVSSLLALLVQARMIAAEEDADPALQSWEFHDLLFHARSREGRHGAPSGAAFPQAGRLPPPPALVPAAARETVALHRPDLDALQQYDPPFAWVQEQRRSVRDYAAEPLNERQLGEFLYRVGRVKECREAELETPHGPVRLGFASRPYPAGGALYELELYAVVNRCLGLGAGLYSYDGLEHRLGRLAARTPEVDQLLREAGWAAGIAPEELQVLLIVTARLPRVSWKYASLAYALVLKHVGVVYQTMYLAATAMGLAPCALGTGNSDLFARVSGVDSHAQPSVGEFLLGTKP